MRLSVLLPRVLVPVLVWPVCPACSSLYHGSFRGDGFAYKRYGYSVCFADRDRKTFISEGWEVDNFTRHPLKGTFKLKTGKRYIGYKIVDRDRDGEMEKERAFVFDLILEHERTPGVIWIQTFELQPDDGAKKLDVFIKSYVDSLKETGEFRDGNPYHKLKWKTNYMVTVEGTQYIRIRGSPATVVTVRIRNMEELKANPGTDGKYLVVTVTKLTSLEEEAIGATSLLLVGYTNDARNFRRQIPDYYRFIDRIRLTTRRCR